MPLRPVLAAAIVLPAVAGAFLWFGARAYFRELTPLAAVAIGVLAGYPVRRAFQRAARARGQRAAPALRSVGLGALVALAAIAAGQALVARSIAVRFGRCFEWSLACLADGWRRGYLDSLFDWSGLGLAVLVAALAARPPADRAIHPASRAQR